MSNQDEMQAIIDSIDKHSSREEIEDAMRKLAEAAGIDLEDYSVESEQFLTSFLSYLNDHFESGESLEMRPNIVQMLKLLGYSTVIINRIGAARLALSEDPSDEKALSALTEAFDDVARIHEDILSMSNQATELVKEAIGV